ncbi:DEAD/DEAH box helicase [Vibrio europaeus]|uniref:DEAD/DEAH box helicase family protein n=1 Tax=Vibrio europaeus TaxID=300876 RepID=A0A178J6N5_9VIBR|nr:DEAD/DEAH box helicase family protein [Vibrio europaeus]MDC5706173.1 DEAD/DEAH box helicase family protein [Vibrio europaeus]MDC5709583.1 DEAD/DEAH box helicase family protein [Vibrio europaeus]MDC5713982.1 DEAD/DEAH box helicase family protein [Vibrio europaeus]MDC5723409.1 DEAD/DEAH box helicase family protein [Vibrio europaeus]MDC5730546.1 DEAD/DEAH box helicase family protein [Vibrio europaeus]
MLRVWQRECVQLAHAKYKNGVSHFLAQATPGAGKTIMAACLAKKLLDEKMIDFVVCFSPSKVVAASIENTFSRHLACKFKGQIGDKGISITYQSLRSVSQAFWDTLANYRVLCVFDEIHHCGGDNDDNYNSWGYHTLGIVQKAATYTLALTGTPWRSNQTPVTLATYSDPEGKILCDYQYTLSQAVQDRVCRRPNIALIDCNKTEFSDSNGSEVFGSINELVSSGYVRYSAVIKNTDALNHILEEGVNRLKRIRRTNKCAGGLIVASSIKHARQIAQILSKRFSQSTTIVTYKTQDAQSTIQRFRDSACSWIISVGMISEGTDIPRLQVCCYLSNIKTELYFRQVLGRILRTTKDRDQEAWLYTFAEEKLLQFAEQVETDIPESCTFISKSVSNHQELSVLTETSLYSDTRDEDMVANGLLSWDSSDKCDLTRIAEDSGSFQHVHLEGFNQRVIEAFRDIKSQY